MVEFDQMVRNILWEQDGQNAGAQPLATTPTATPATSTDEEDTKQDTSSIFGFLTTGSPIPYNDLTTLWQKFKNYKICTKDELNSLCYNVVSSKPRSTKTPEKFSNIEHIYPLLDLIATLYEQNFKGRTQANVATAPNTFKAFEERLKRQLQTNPNLKPLDYNALDPWAQSIKSALLTTSREELGKLRLSTQNDNSSIYQLIFNLLAIRKKAISPKLPLALKNLSGEGIVNAIMLEPWKLVSGNFAINDEKIKAVYDSTTVSELVSLSLAAYKLYTQQSESLIGTKDDKLYSLFIGKGGVKPVPWPIPVPVNASFDQTFELLNKQLLSEAGQSDVDTRTQAEIMRDIRNNVNNSYLARQSSRYRSNANQAEQRAFETAAGSGQFKYDFKSIKEASTKFKIEEATNLLQQLQSFADFIKTKEGRDIVGGVTKIAQGLTLGAKNMGS